MAERRGQTRYSLGTILATADLEEFNTAPFKALDRARLNPGSVHWTSGDSYSLIPSEQAADDIVAAIRRQYPDNVVEDGLKPLVAVDGMASYEKYVVLKLTDSERSGFRQFLARQAGCQARQIGEIEDLPDRRVRRI